MSDIFLSAMNNWRDNKGIGTALIPSPLDDRQMVLGVLQRVYAKRPDSNTLVVVSNFNDRIILNEFLTTQENTENNEEFKKLLDDKKIKIFTIDFVEKTDLSKINLNCILCYRIDKLNSNLINLLNNIKFKLIILNKLNLSASDIVKIYSICPLLSDFKQAEINEIRSSTPVKEMRIGISIPKDSEDFKLLNYYNEYISTSVNLFGSLDNMEYAKYGDKRANISATKFCYELAYENGWDEHLDMSISINKQVDELYNPNAIHARALETYDIIRLRTTFLAGYNGKLDEILKIVQNNPDKKILIINKFGDFAATVTKFLNNMSELEICGNYHDRVDPVPATTLDGTPIFIKSGIHKGERKFFAAQAQKTFNVERFNLNYINVLSCNNSPSKDLNIPVDIVIITSPLSEEIESYIYRLSKITFPSKEIELYSLYVKDSIESKKLANKFTSKTHIILNPEEINDSNIDEFDFDIED